MAWPVSCCPPFAVWAATSLGGPGLLERSGIGASQCFGLGRVAALLRFDPLALGAASLAAYSILF